MGKRLIPIRAHLLQDAVDHFKTNVKFYELSHPVDLSRAMTDKTLSHIKYVVASSLENETFLFAVNERGRPLSWVELPGSIRRHPTNDGVDRHSEAIENFLRIVNPV